MAIFDQNGSNQQKESKYSKLLNNLLEIRIGDACWFSKITATSYDIYTKLGREQTSDFLTKDECKIKMRDLDIANLISELKNIQKDLKEEINKLKNSNITIWNDISEKVKWETLSFYGAQAIKAYENFNQPLTNVLKTNLMTLQDSTPLDNAIIKLQQDQQKLLNHWKKFAKLVDDKQNITNMWPLYIAAGFVTVNFGDGKVINAPLFLKRAKIVISGSNVNLETNGDWILNEKLIYILKRHDFFVPKNIETEDKSFLNSINEILHYLKIEEQPLSFYLNKFKNFKRDEVENKKIEINPGIILGIFYPSGGYLREWMQKIIDKDEIDEILKINPDKKIYEDKVYEVLENNYGDIVKIQQSSYAQDKALISALNQDTVIWGPPGTGKSQVIANIIANVLYNQKSAIVISQKKAALDVLKKRLKGLAKFVFFFMYETELSKEAFYSQLRSFIEAVEYSQNVAYRDKQNIISPEQIDAINKINKLKIEGKYQAVIQTYKNTEGDIEKIKKLARVDPQYFYPVSVKDENDFIDGAGQLNNVKKDGYIFWWKYPDKFVKKINTAFKTKEDLKLNNLSETIKPFKTANINDMQYLSQVPNILKYNYEQIDDESFIDNFLCRKILEKIKNKFSTGSTEFKKYDRFRAAVMAGRRTPHNFVKDHIEVIRELFPVIVVTPSTVFFNCEKGAFDYAIIDEASQMFLEFGLPIMYFSKIRVLAGDPEQMRPTNWFSSRDISDDEDEQDNAENATSVLDYAIDKQVYKIMLDQNYRSNAASLMSFSSKEFYKSKLEVVNKKDYMNEKSIEVINVNGEWNKGTNEREIQEVIKLLKRFGSSYDTIIVLAFNIKQKQLIEETLIEKEHTLWKRVQNGSITIRNIENIQGDEADLVIASVVYDENTRMSGTYVARAGTGKNALNVAISRAKSKMIVVKSVNSDTIHHANSEDFQVFKEWLSFLDLKEEDQRTYSTLKESLTQYGDFESTFEEDVYERLIKDLKFEDGKSYKIAKQFPVGSKHLDIAILRNDRDFILGIEVDGYNYHLGKGVDKYLQDQAREEFIKSKGYNILRIPDIKWYLDANKVVENIQQTINNVILN